MISLLFFMPKNLNTLICRFYAIFANTKNYFMSRLKSFIANPFVQHLFLAGGVITLFVAAVLLSLSVYTNHGDHSEVPDIRGLNDKQCEGIVVRRGFRYVVSDSVHVVGAAPGAIIDQYPLPGAKVKKNRSIHVTVNAYTVEKVQIPNLVDYSLRNARVMLESFGLKVGKLIYAPSEFVNLVLGQHYEGKPIEAGVAVPKGAVIDLIIGHGLGDVRVNVPNLVSLDLESARQVCQAASLNLGAIICDETVITQADSLAAFVIKQQPDSFAGSQLQQGSTIDVWLSKRAPQTTSSKDEEVF